MKNRIISFFVTLVMIGGLCCILPTQQVEAASNSWAWPTSITTIKNDWPNYISSGKYHAGTDFAVPVDSPVYSTCDGEVVTVETLLDDNGNYRSYGKYIKIKAVVDGATVYMRYCHLNNFAVNKGDKVVAGQIIGYSGATGNVTGPHLHYEVRNSNDTYGSSASPNLNPKDFLPGSRKSFETFSSPPPTNPPATDPAPTPSPDNNHQPLLTLDSATGGAGEIKLYGWSYDPDTLSASVEIHVYISPATDTNKMIMAGSFKADNGRPDVDAAYGCGSMHGFDDIIYVTEPGEYLVRVAALDTTYGGDAATWVQGDFVWVTESPKYTIKYDMNGGSGTISSQTKTKGVNLKLSTTVPTKNYTVTYNAMGGEVNAGSKKVSCKFLGWSTSKTATSAEYKSGGTFSKNANTTLYAVWQNQKIAELFVPTKNGYTFDGWYTEETGGSKVTADTVISKNTTIYAHWTKNKATGDINADGELNIADAVTLQRWLLGMSYIDLNDWKAADLYADGIIDIFDLILMREKLVA